MSAGEGFRDMNYKRKICRQIFSAIFSVAIILLIFVTLLALHHVKQARATNNSLAVTPLMGWSSWSTIRENPNEANIETQARAMATILK
ncbi:MAG TPA: hypothetical protein VKB76_11645, partial [Ktedonobacterales bacterium]|nr:hypothetical protein [Ktedonobacterales bacterium]